MRARRPANWTHVTLVTLAIVGACAKAEESPLADQGGDDDGKGGSSASGGSTMGGSGGMSGSGATAGSAGKGGSTGGSAGKSGTSGKGGTTSTGGTASKGGSTSTGGTGGTRPTTYGCLGGEGGEGGGAGTGSASDGGAGGSGPSTLFEDDFEDGNASSWTTTSGSWSVVTDDSEVYQQNDRTNNDQHISAMSSTCWGDQIVEANVKVVSFGGSSTSYAVSLFARYVNATTHYIVGIDSGNNGEIFIGRRINSTSTAPDRIVTKTRLVSDGLFAEGEWHKLRLEVIGTTLTAFLDDDQVLSTTDAQITSGGVAIGTRHAQAMFDDVKVTAP